MKELGLEDGLVRLARVGDERPLAVEMVEGTVVLLSGEERSHPGGALDGSGHNSLVSVSPIGPWVTRNGLGRMRSERALRVDALTRLGHHSAVP
ncbi:hypothetical protein ABZ351_28790 [Streptomyces microflavus]|uniref:hypothetical protein n=1 Tax=Streptomyces microflavus TaxID=1919 RepID=UPI0033D2D3C8